MKISTVVLRLCEQDIHCFGETETGKHNGRSNDGGSETTFLSASCPSFAHPPNRFHSLPPPFPLTITRQRCRGGGGRGEGEEGCWTIITKLTRAECVRAVVAASYPSRHFAVASTRCPCMAASRGALLASLALLHTSSPHSVSSLHCVSTRHFTRSEPAKST